MHYWTLPILPLVNRINHKIREQDLKMNQRSQFKRRTQIHRSVVSNQTLRR